MDETKQILREYEKDRDEALQILSLKYDEVYKKIPRIKSIDNELQLMSVRTAKMVLDTLDESLLNDLTIKSQQLLEEKKLLLSDFGFAENYLTIRYKCNKCNDTGYVENKKCTCFMERKIKRTIDNSNIRQIIKSENFANFDFDYYSSEKYENEHMTPRENMQRVHAHCMRFCDEFDNAYRNLYMYGKTGLGKTYLCNCIAKYLLDSGKTVQYSPAFQLFKSFEDARFNKVKEINNDYLNSIMHCDLLIIDDLGTEFSTVLSSSELFNIINCRILWKRPTVISTNLSHSELVNYYSDRIVSRILGNFNSLKFYGEDIRIKKKYR